MTTNRSDLRRVLGAVFQLSYPRSARPVAARMRNRWRSWVAGTFFPLSLVGTSPAWADGAVIDGGGYYVTETRQDAFIDWKDGTERLFISTETQSYDGPTLWVVPVPAPPDQVDAEPVESIPLPELMTNVAATAPRVLDDVRRWALMLNSGFVAYPFVKKPPARFASVGSAAGDFGSRGDRGIAVHQHVEKLGMVVEVLTAKSTDSLDAYLQSKKVDVRAAQITALHSYVQTDCTLICGWSAEQSEGRQARAVKIDFPTDDIFYPLKPTSVYSSDIETVIFVRGFFEPVWTTNLRGLTMSYVNAKIFVADLDDTLLGRGTTSHDMLMRAPVKLTRIEVSGPASQWTQDLVLEPGAPTAVHLARFIKTLDGIPFFVILQAGLGAFLGVAVPYLLMSPDRRRRTDFLWCVGVGAAMLLSVLAAVIVFCFWYRRRCAEDPSRGRLAAKALTSVCAGALLLVIGGLTGHDGHLHILHQTEALALALTCYVAMPLAIIASVRTAGWRAYCLLYIAAAHSGFMLVINSALKALIGPYAWGGVF